MISFAISQSNVKSVPNAGNDYEVVVEFIADVASSRLLITVTYRVAKPNLKVVIQDPCQKKVQVARLLPNNHN
jgi:hypothetical protein